MKKIFFFAAAAVFALASCNGNKKADAVDSETVLAEEIVEVEETPGVEFTYNADFFRDAANKGAGTDSTYVETPSGLRYAVIQEGTGASPSAEDNVTVHYSGELVNGKVFDSSVLRGEPATFPLNGVIKGWTEGLQTMKEGGITEFYIPADLAYGENGTPDGSIPPNAPLIFRVELLKVNK